MTKANGRRSRAGSDSTKERIVQSAIELFGRAGYEATSVQEIVERAGLTKGAFYHCLNEKQDLLREIHDRFMGQLLRSVEETFEVESSPSTQLESVILKTIVTAAENQVELSIFIEERRHLDAKSFLHVRKKRDDYLAHLEQILNEGAKQGEFRIDTTPRIVAFGIIGMCAWSFLWYREDAISIKRIGAEYARVILNGLLTDKAPVSGEDQVRLPKTDRTPKKRPTK